MGAVAVLQGIPDEVIDARDFGSEVGAFDLTALDNGGYALTYAMLTDEERAALECAAEVRVVCTLLRRGRNLAFGEIRLLTPQGQLAAHATCTYAIL